MRVELMIRSFCSQKAVEELLMGGTESEHLADGATKNSYGVLGHQVVHLVRFYRGDVPAQCPCLFAINR